MEESKRISERIDQSGVSVSDDDKDWVIKNVVVVNRESRNGRRYTESALQDIRRLAERNPVAIEHEDEHGRRYTDRNGQLRSPRLDGQRVVADYHLNENHPTSPQIRTDARKFAENLCMSIEIDEGQWEGHLASDGKLEVTRVKELLDTSIVARGGTTKTLYESLEKPRKKAKRMSDKPINDQIEAKLREAEERRKQQDHIDKVTRELEDEKALSAKLKEELTSYRQKEERAAKVSRIKEEAKKLNAGEISDNYAMTLAKLDDSEITSALTDRAKLLETAGHSTTLTGSDPPTVTGTPKTRSILDLQFS